MHHNGIKSATRKQAGDVIIRTADITGTGALRSIAPPVEPNVHKRRLDD